jgi:hypothetical protein
MQTALQASCLTGGKEDPDALWLSGLCPHVLRQKSSNTRQFGAQNNKCIV